MRDAYGKRVTTSGQRLGVSRDNHEFDVWSDTWTLNKEVTIELEDVLDLLEMSLHEPYRMMMKYYAENYAPWYCFNIHIRTRKFLEDMDAEGFSTKALRNYRTQLGREKEWMLGGIRAFLCRWYNQGYPGISDEVVEWLQSVRLKKNQCGRSVRSMDPHDGPFDDQEISAILEAAPQAYEQGRVTLATLAWTLLLSYTGRRPGQLSMLRVGDFQETTTTDGRRIDIVCIPRTKQRGQPPRAEFKAFWLASDVCRVLKAQRDVVIERVEARLGKLSGSIAQELPLFPHWHGFRRVRSVEELQHALRNDGLHVRTDDVRKRLKKIRVVSARTGKRLHITPRRFRYTLGTRAARLGYGALVIAELLDHSDLQNVFVYTRNHPNFRQKVDDAVGEQLAPVASAFLRRVVDCEADARHGSDPSMRIGTREQKVGSCGSRGFCGAEALACYTCMHFQPWLHAPHHKMEEWMLERQQEMKDAGASETVVSALDKSILGVRAVMAVCNARKAEIVGAPNA